MPRHPKAPRRLHHEWRQRALKEKHFIRQLDTSQYHEALIELMGLGREVIDDPNWNESASPVVPPDAIELRPPPPSAAWIRKVKSMEDSGMTTSLFLYDTVGYSHPPRAFKEFDAKYLFNFISAGNRLDLPRPADAPKQLHYKWRQRYLKEKHFFKQITTQEYHEALILLMTLGRDIVDDQDIVDVIARCPDEQVSYSSGWGSREASAWRSGRDIRQPQIVTRDPPPPATTWAPHPGPSAAVGQPVIGRIIFYFKL